MDLSPGDRPRAPNIPTHDTQAGIMASCRRSLSLGFPVHLRGQKLGFIEETRTGEALLPCRLLPPPMMWHNGNCHQELIRTGQAFHL